jgi:hypothetical protein
MKVAIYARYPSEMIGGRRLLGSHSTTSAARRYAVSSRRPAPRTSRPAVSVPSQPQAATTLIRAAFRERGFRRITISTSWSSAVKRFIRRSTEKPSSL